MASFLLLLASEDNWKRMVSSLLCLAVLSGFLQTALRSFRLRYSKHAKPPEAPGAVPILGHALMFLRDPEKLASILAYVIALKPCGTSFDFLHRSPAGSPLTRFTLPTTDLWLVRGPERIYDVLMSPHIFDFVAVSVLFLRNVLEMPNNIIRMIRYDNSGIGRKPFAGSNIPPNRRFMHLKYKATHDVIARSGLPILVYKFEENLMQWITQSSIDDTGMTVPDLYVLLRDVLFRASVNAFFGPHLLGDSPNLTEDLWQFDEDVGYLTKGFPAFLKPQTRVARDRCIQAVKVWRSRAKSNQPDGASLPEWDKHWGSKFMRLRSDVFNKFEEWDDQSCAATDTAILWATNTNIVPATFWFIYEIISSTPLLAEVRAEVSKAVIDNATSKFDNSKLLSSPLLQSIYAETLRMYVAVMMVRETTKECHLGDWTVPKKQSLVVCSYTEHMDARHWNTGTEQDPHPVDQFWAKRFLQDTDSGPVFSVSEMGGKFLPYGLGERMCPGRHFAKHQMILTLAHLVENFEFELSAPSGYRPALNMHHFGTGTLPPADQIPCHIRRVARRL
ncbi:cytochrome P450 [Clathrospora elynae]|uniref:Cytochrome P450 n=1 Tax=Clathrospora elynae TaxID=706981 RepID=A0A6A5SK46_9PLEO|nr:cytochrome P450 [Clathrospora elynae]